MGAKPVPCYNRIRAINDRVMRLQCIFMLLLIDRGLSLWQCCHKGAVDQQGHCHCCRKGAVARVLLIRDRAETSTTDSSTWEFFSGAESSTVDGPDRLHYKSSTGTGPDCLHYICWNALLPGVVNACSFNIFVNELNCLDVSRFCHIGQA